MKYINVLILTILLIGFCAVCIVDAKQNNTSYKVSNVLTCNQPEYNITINNITPMVGNITLLIQGKPKIVTYHYNITTYNRTLIGFNTTTCNTNTKTLINKNKLVIKTKQ